MQTASHKRSSKFNLVPVDRDFHDVNLCVILTRHLDAHATSKYGKHLMCPVLMKGSSLMCYYLLMDYFFSN